MGKKISKRPQQHLAGPGPAGLGRGVLRGGHASASAAACACTWRGCVRLSQGRESGGGRCTGSIAESEFSDSNHRAPSQRTMADFGALQSAMVRGGGTTGQFAVGTRVKVVGYCEGVVRFYGETARPERPRALLAGTAAAGAVRRAHVLCGQLATRCAGGTRAAAHVVCACASVRLNMCTTPNARMAHSLRAASA